MLHALCPGLCTPSNFLRFKHKVNVQHDGCTLEWILTDNILDCKGEPFSHRWTIQSPQCMWRTWQLALLTGWWKTSFILWRIESCHIKNMHPIGWLPVVYLFISFSLLSSVCLSNTSHWQPPLKEHPWRIEVRAEFICLEDNRRVKCSFGFLTTNLPKLL